MNDWSEPNYDEQGNPLAIVGLLLAICVGPIGLVISLVAMTRRPRGLAIAGVVVGLLTTMIIVVTISMTVRIVGDIGNMVEHVKHLDDDIDAITMMIREHEETEGAYPEYIELLDIDPEALTDPWNRPYSYSRRADGTNWFLTSFGEDGLPDTDDDLVFDRYLDDVGVYIFYESQKIAERFGAPKQVGDSMDCFVDMARLGHAVEAYVEEHSAPPASIADIPGMETWMTEDPWGNPYIYEHDEETGNFSFGSLGADGQAGTSDDLNSDDATYRVN